MSINSTRDDMVAPPRQGQAETAGYIIYNSFSQSSLSNQRPPGDSPAARMSSSNSQLSSAHVEGSENGKMSAVRRTFCLVATFDLILTFVLWVIYTEDLGLKSGWTGFLVQVQNYEFEYSLFDIVMMSAARFAGLILAYALFRIRHWWMVAVTTFAACVLLLVKCFLFDFNCSPPDTTMPSIIIRGKVCNALCYVLLIFSFIVVWGEVWFLDFKVLPQEEKVRRRAASNSYSERSPLLGPGGRQTLHPDTNRYYTPEGSDDEHTESEAEYRSLPGTRGHSRNASRSSINSAGSLREQEYLRMGKETLSIVLDMYRMEDGWKHETGLSLLDGIVSSQHMKNIGKVFRLEAIVNLGTSDLYQDVVYGINDLPQWNPTVLESKTLQVVDGSTEVAYSIAGEAVGGLISSRDFITLRHWGCTDGIYYSTGCNATHPDMPPTKKHVRGENGHGGWLFTDVPDQPDQCLFIWYINANLKGWLPQTLIDQGLSSYLIEYLGYMRKHIEDMNDSRDSDPA